MNDIPTTYTNYDPLTPLFNKSLEGENITHHREFREQYLQSQEEADNGELIIKIPEILREKLSQNAVNRKYCIYFQHHSLKLLSIFI